MDAVAMLIVHHHQTQSELRIWFYLFCFIFIHNRLVLHNSKRMLEWLLDDNRELSNSMLFPLMLECVSKVFFVSFAVIVISISLPDCHCTI